MPNALTPLIQCPSHVLQRVDFLLSDLDDTISTDGKVSASSYVALETVQKLGVKVVIVTGRPAGWCDMIARFWPVDAVIGENGAFYFKYDTTSKCMQRHFQQTEEQRAENAAALSNALAHISTRFPALRTAADQRFRISDLAIDVSEDTQPVEPATIDQILKYFRDSGITAKLSSIHINAWKGSFDKYSMSKQLLCQEYGLKAHEFATRVAFVGDSPNDEPMFEKFELSIGVQNILHFKHSLTHLPQYVTTSRSGAGFCELASLLAQSKSTSPKTSL